MSLIGRTKLFKGKVLVSLIGAIALFSLSSCQDITQAEKSSVRNASTSGAVNGPVLVYQNNPAVLRGNSNITVPGWSKYLSYESIAADYYLQSKCDFKQASFTTAVESTGNCVEVYKNDQAEPIQKNADSWNYTVDSDEFYQVNVFYHSKKIIDKFLDSMQYNHELTHSLSSLFIPPAFKYNPTVTKSFWLGESGISKALKVYSKCEFEGANINSYFDPAEDTMCLGWNANQPKLHMAQDPSVLYHEMGHVFVKIMMNQRNVTYNSADLKFNSIDFKSDLGTMDYDEAGAINEGIADFFSYYMTGRRYIGEWGMDRIPYLIQESQGFQGQKFGRPMDEDDTSHISGVSGSTPGEKLSYPEYINYNAHSPNTRYEGEIHYAGQIISHYLARLTETFKNSCYTHENISEYVESNTDESAHYSAATLTLLLINETLAEIGDLTAKGSDYFNNYAITSNPTLANVFFTNLNADESFLWTHQVTPPNMRRFFKIFAKNIRHYISSPSDGLCTSFTTDQSEQLLDEYGLLLFKSYGDAGQGTLVSGATATDVKYEDFDMVTLPYISNFNIFSALTNSNEVSEFNRKETVLVSKDYIDLPSDTRATAYIFDGRSEIQGILNKLTFEGENVIPTSDLAGVEYNNDNIKISPGEVVGVSLNLVNSSNSTMSGVQVLGNDWDHMKLDDSATRFVNRKENLSTIPYMNQIANWSPCQIDGWPLDTEGGVIWDPNTPGTDGDCEHITKTNKKMDALVFPVDPDTDLIYPYYELDAPQPICLVQYSDENETKWVSQDFFRKHELGLEDHECLNNEATGANFNPNECLIRMLPGADHAVFGQIAPQKTWLETISVNNEDPRHASSNITLMEVNKWIQPGTTFNCRFRVRFTNCQDCFNENGTGEDYKDYEYAGMKPYKVINFSFKVID